MFQSYFYRVSQKKVCFKILVWNWFVRLSQREPCPKDWSALRWPWIERTIQFQRRILKQTFIWDTLYKKNLWNCCEVAWRVFPLERKMQIYWVAKIADQSRDLGSRKSNCLTTVKGFFQMWTMCIGCRHMFRAGLTFILSRSICALDSNSEETDMGNGVFCNQIACNFEWLVSIREGLAEKKLTR